MARPGLEPKVSRLLCEHHLATEPHSQPVTISPCLNKFVPKSARNHAGTNETVPLLLAARAWTHTEPPNVTGGETWPDRDSNPGSLAYRAGTIELRSHMASPLQMLQLHCVSKALLSSLCYTYTYQISMGKQDLIYTYMYYSYLQSVCVFPFYSFLLLESHSPCFAFVFLCLT